MIGIFVRQYELEKKPIQQMQLIEEDIVTKKSTKIDGLEPYFLLPLSTLLLLYSKKIDWLTNQKRDKLTVDIFRMTLATALFFDSRRSGFSIVQGF